MGGDIKSTDLQKISPQSRRLVTKVALIHNNVQHSILQQLIIMCLISGEASSYQKDT